MVNMVMARSMSMARLRLLNASVVEVVVMVLCFRLLLVSFC